MRVCGTANSKNGVKIRLMGLLVILCEIDCIAKKAEKSRSRKMKISRWVFKFNSLIEVHFSQNTPHDIYY